MKQATEKLNQLTFTRFLAALSVMFYHSGRDVGVLQYLPFLTSGQTAVSYFYVLSGFVMAYVYYRPTVPFKFWEYFIARFSRIYPVYVLSFILTFFYFMDRVPKTPTGEIFANLFLYQAWIPEYSSRYNIAAWSLSVEVFFYILLPFLVFYSFKISVKKLIWLSLGFWGLSQLIHSILFIAFSPERPMFFLSFFPPFHINTFFIGFAGGVWYLNRQVEPKISVFVKSTLLILPLVVVSIGLYYRDVKHIFGNTFYLDTGLFAPLFLVTVLTLASDTTKLAKVLSHPWLVLLGDASYAIYILHVPFRWWLQSMTGNLATETFLRLYILITITLCILIYKYIEVPTQKWLRSNSQKIFFIFFDVILIALIIKLAFVLRLGAYTTDFPRTQKFIIFFGTTIFFVLLITCQFYKTYSWHALGFSSFFGIAILTGLVYYASQKMWIEIFPRTVLIMIPFFVFSSIYLSNHFSAKKTLKNK